MHQVGHYQILSGSFPYCDPLQDIGCYLRFGCTCCLLLYGRTGQEESTYGLRMSREMFQTIFSLKFEQVGSQAYGIGGETRLLMIFDFVFRELRSFV